MTDIFPSTNGLYIHGGEVKFLPPRMTGYHWFESSDSAIEDMVQEAMKHFDENKTTQKPQDRVIRAEATRLLLTTLASSGQNGIPVSIADKEHGVATSPERRFPQGHLKALEMLQGLALVDKCILGNPDGSMLDAMRSMEDGFPMASPFHKDYDSRGTRGIAGGYRLTEFAWSLLVANNFNPQSITKACARLIRVKHEKERIAPAEHPKLELWRDQLSSFNLKLRDFTFSLDGQPLQASELELHRTFSDQAYGTGGRFYSHFSSYPAEEEYRCGDMVLKPRNLLEIDGRRVLSFDYSGLHARLSLSCLGIPWGESDPREKGTLGQFDKADVKTVWNASLNSVREDGYTKALERDKDRPLGGPDAEQVTRAVIAAMIAEFPGIQSAFGGKMGLKLQRADAEAVTTYLDYFMCRNRPVVPLHDGLYCLPADQDHLRGAEILALDAMYDVLAQTWPELVKNPLPLICASQLP
jgi:hypothetical protein